MYLYKYCYTCVKVCFILINLYTTKHTLAFLFFCNACFVIKVVTSTSKYMMVLIFEHNGLLRSFYITAAFCSHCYPVGGVTLEQPDWSQQDLKTFYWTSSKNKNLSNDAQFQNAEIESMFQMRAVHNGRRLKYLGHILWK